MAKKKELTMKPPILRFLFTQYDYCVKKFPFPLTLLIINLEILNHKP